MKIPLIVLLILAVSLAGTIVFASLVVYKRRFSVLQTALLLLAKLLVRFQWRTTLADNFPIEPGRGAIIVSNHRSSVDPFFVQACLDRPVYWMVAKEYCEHPVFGWFLKICAVIPVNRGGIDIAATKAAIRAVDGGALIGMFPEGRINVSDQFMMPLRPGAALVAQKTGVPMVPCYVRGTPYRDTAWSPFLMRARCRVEFSEPIQPPAESDQAPERLRETIIAVARSIAKLAGENDYQPKIAGPKWKPTEAEIEEALEASRQRQVHASRQQES